MVACLPTLKNPSLEDQLLFICTRQSFLPAHRSALASILHRQSLRWDEVYATAVAHGVAPLIYTNMSRCPDVLAQVPPAVRGKFERCTQINVLVKELHAERIRGVLEFFALRSVPVLLVKGASLDRTVYLEPWYTLSADIDLMIRCRQEDFPGADLPNVHALVQGRNPFERRQNVEFEWFGHHDVSMNNLFPVDFVAIWKEARPIKVLDQAALIMAPEHMLLAACTNSCRKRFFRLKALCDIAEIIAAHPINWDKVVATARQWRCEIIAYTALLVAAMTLQCPLPQGVLDELRVPRWRRQAIEFLSRRQSFASLATLSRGSHALNRRLGAGILLPLAAYRLKELLTNIRIVTANFPFAR